jgi:hypothetical protein
MKKKEEKFQWFSWLAGDDDARSSNSFHVD